MKTINFKKAAKSFFALPVAVGLLPSQASAADISVPEKLLSRHEYVQAPTCGAFAPSTVTTMDSVQIVLQDKKLTFYEEQRFHKLAIKETIGSLTDAEKAELESLDRRRTVDKTLPTEAVVARERLFSKMDELLKALDQIGA